MANNAKCCRGYRLLLLRSVKRCVSRSWERSFWRLMGTGMVIIFRRLRKELWGKFGERVKIAPLRMLGIKGKAEIKMIPIQHDQETMFSCDLIYL